MAQSALSTKPLASKHHSAAPQRASPSNRKTALFDALAEAAIRINPALPNPWDLVVKDENLFVRRIMSPLSNGLTALGDMYVEGIWECEDLSAFFYRALKARLNSRFTWCLPNVIRYCMAVLFNQQTRSKAARDVSSHYDLGPVFEIMLDPTMAYSCAYWKEGVSNLEEAQLAKHDLCCRKLEISSGMAVLDTGCGWGGFLKHSAERYGARPCLGVTLAPKQVALGTERCRGLPISLLVQDYRDVSGAFDRIASIGILEHVGPKNYRAYFRKMYEVLKPGGLLLVHAIGSVISSPTLRLPEGEWLNREIFPGGVLPSFGQIASASDGLFTLLDAQEFGPYYDLTLMAWNENFERGWPEIQHLYDARFYRLWRYYLHFCAAAFRAGNNYKLWQVVFGKDYQGVYKSVR
ncbi:MAG: cyclopropane fatty acyl phospholipid synthase [Terrimicrobiaceae bacterium]